MGRDAACLAPEQLNSRQLDCETESNSQAGWDNLPGWGFEDPSFRVEKIKVGRFFWAGLMVDSISLTAQTFFNR
ncbi:hypothetical protein BGE01nite_47430 [Brevifollis gellanilyticus]|uniref:Uncharacterized protein n=1 Tax=Brevifollis gellanilyticus TaxID=748831 RepID=A0A512MFG0_9BACT|nr:hypothetical protein BGE01nite_47430 [Brevifollis gellanilyticus]